MTVKGGRHQLTGMVSQSWTFLNGAMEKYIKSGKNITMLLIKIITASHVVLSIH